MKTGPPWGQRCGGNDTSNCCNDSLTRLKYIWLNGNNEFYVYRSKAYNWPGQFKT